ncbi:MAG TPA: benzoate-CoA ligase family protein [Pyrinomonadaceae bacterium]|nr:benzoate-CoA ligase family protein [Pyrinomonadaceae bacterium]
MNREKRALSIYDLRFTIYDSGVNLVRYVFQETEKRNGWSLPAILYRDAAVSYEELFRLVRKCGGMMKTLGIKPGDRVAIIAADCPQWIIAFLGAIAAGAVAVPASTMLTSVELQYVLDHCGAKAAVITSEQVEKLQAVRSSLHKLENVLLIDGEADGMMSFKDWLGEAAEAEIETVSDDALAFILYTSGSTGQPKGAMHIHRNLPYTVETFCKHVLQVAPGDRLFSSSRLFFAYGLGNSLSFPLSSGASVVLCKEKPTPTVIARIFERQRPTIFFSVPAVYRALIEYASEVNRLETRSIKFCVSAGEKLPEKIFYEWRELTGLNILDGIGSTEMLQMFISNTKEKIVPGSSGQVVPGYEAKLVDHAEQEVAGAGTGNLMIKGGSASSGYWNDEAKTAATIENGWMRTGDLYRRDENENYWFEGRSDDLFKVKGLWVSPIEVEDALLSCDEVLEAAVVSGLNDDGMNTVLAYVVVRSKEFSEKDMAERLKAHASRLLSSYKCPTEIHFMNQLPRTATGKLQRFKLRETAESGSMPALRNGGITP